MIIKEEHPKVTIVTITYNLIKAGRTDSFKQAVESVHRQNYDNIEHIIIDGASTDGSKELIEEYVKKKWVICFSEPDKGIYDAMNKGLQKATGDYVWFINAGDSLFTSDIVQRVASLVQKKKFCLILFMEKRLLLMKKVNR